MSRRTLLTGGGVGLGGLVVGGAAGYFGRGSSTTTVTQGAHEPAGSSTLKALSPAEAHTLEAVLERILPSDASGPGAKEANVLRYIDWSLAGDLSAFRGPYSSAIAAIEAYSQAKFKDAFVNLSPEKQDTLLKHMESNVVAAGFTPSSKAVFDMIRGHAIEGMFGDPAHGGNAGYVGWKLVRFPGPQPVVTARDQQLDVVRKPNMTSSYSLQPFKQTNVDA